MSTKTRLSPTIFVTLPITDQPWAFPTISDFFPPCLPIMYLIHITLAITNIRTLTISYCFLFIKYLPLLLKNMTPYVTSPYVKADCFVLCNSATVPHIFSPFISPKNRLHCSLSLQRLSNSNMPEFHPNHKILNILLIIFLLSILLPPF